MFKTTLIAITILACSPLAVAQSDDYRKLEFFAGYSYHAIQNNLDEDDVIPDPEQFRGFNTSVTGNVSRYVGLKFDFSGHYKSRPVPFGPLFNGFDVTSRRYNFLGGVQVKDNSISDKWFRPFAHALVGAVHSRNRVNVNPDVCVAIAPTPCPADFTEKETGFSGAFGGGIDVRASDRIYIRLFQLDYNPTRLFDQRQHNLRFAIGIVIH